jgi:hypothetical protein
VAVLHSQEYSWYSFFLLEAESTGRIRPSEESNDLIGHQTHDLPACSIVPQHYCISPVVLNGGMIFEFGDLKSMWKKVYMV